MGQWQKFSNSLRLRFAMRLSNVAEAKAKAAQIVTESEERAQKLVAEAEAILRGATALAPDNADLRWNLALTLLAAGSYAEGWAFYESRRAVQGFSIRPQKMPAASSPHAPPTR